MVAIKGDEIRFIAGKYGGKSGWINTQEAADETVTPVIVNLGRKGARSAPLCTCLRSSEVAHPNLLAMPKPLFSSAQISRRIW
mmetsp:Transcript_1023/g.1383  ORF Transcript_1023/g.1383 Transcript_1023/m.1383 type:complete len:83 (-) Transcript_1023:209-457(-)